MKHVSADTLALVADINQRRMARVMGDRLKRTGGELRMSRNLTDALLMVRTLHRRFMGGKYEMEQGEMAQLRRAAEFLAAEHATQKGSSFQGLEWDEDAAWSHKPQTDGLYRTLLQAVQAGQI